jgi:hypothetical protein
MSEALSEACHRLHVKFVPQSLPPLRTDFHHTELSRGKILLQQSADQGGSHISPADKSNIHCIPFLSRPLEDNDIRPRLHKFNHANDARMQDVMTRIKSLLSCSFLTMRTIKT